MIRDSDADFLERSLQDALQILKDTPLFVEAEDSYKKAIEEAAKLELQVKWIDHSQ